MTSLAWARAQYGRAAVDPGYWDRLLVFIAGHGWELHPNQNRRFCKTFSFLDDPGHRCYGCHGLIPSGIRNFNLDHWLLLRRGDGRYPLQWAILSQPYGGHDDSGLAVNLGPAPYGYGTTALLYVGHERARAR